MCRGVHRVQLPVERTDPVPLDLEVQVAVDVHEEVLEPIGWLRSPGTPVDVARVVFDHPPELELGVLAEAELSAAELVELVLEDLLLVGDSAVVNRDEHVRDVRAVVDGVPCRDDGAWGEHEVLPMLHSWNIILFLIISVLTVVVVVLLNVTMLFLIISTLGHFFISFFRMFLFSFFVHGILEVGVLADRILEVFIIVI